MYDWIKIIFFAISRRLLILSTSFSTSYSNFPNPTPIVEYLSTLIIGWRHLAIHRTLIGTTSTHAHFSFSQWRARHHFDNHPSQIAKFMGSTWTHLGPVGPPKGLMLAPWTLLSGLLCIGRHWHRSSMVRNNDKITLVQVMTWCCQVYSCH